MKTFTKTLIAAGVGLFGIGGIANAATPFGSLTSTQGIAVGGCYQSTSDACYDQYGGRIGSGYGLGSSYDDYAYRSLPSRSVYDDHQSYHTLPYPSNRWDDCQWDNHASTQRRYDDFSFNAPGRRLNSPSNYDHGYGRFDSRGFEDRYDGSPSFEPWRPMSASYTSHKW